ncbi:MAG: hypothetical protein R2912_08645 [Eubacteriales bacterium]
MTSTPPTVTLPALTSQKRAIAEIVLLPQPDGPTSAVIVGGNTCCAARLAWRPILRLHCTETAA